MSHVVVMVRYVAQPGKADEALSAIQALVNQVLAAEPQCGGIEVLRDLANPERITLVERWPDRDSFLGPHMQQPHLQAFIQSAGEFLAGPPEIGFHASVGGTATR